MRNLKKALVLVLSLAMILGIMVVGAGAAFADQSEIDSAHKDAVDMCVSLNIINGIEQDGKTIFKPTGNVTREQMAKMICILDNGGKEPQLASGSSFTDVAADRWSNPYIEACAARGVVAGVGDGKFNPGGDVTATQAAKMLLVELGYKEDLAKYTGSSWATNVNLDATKNGYYEDLEDIDVSAPLSREHAAQMIWNALQADMIEYDYTLVTDPVTGQLISKEDPKATGPELLSDKYGADVCQAYMSDITYNSDKDEYTYSFSPIDFNGLAVDDFYGSSIKSSKDFSDLYGMKVKVVAKGDKLYGITAFESEAMVSGILGDLPTTIDPSAKSVKIDGTTYDLQDQASSIPVYGYVDGQYTTLDSARAPFALHYAFDLIDNNDDGKANCMVIYPVEVGQIAYLNGDKFTVKSVGSTSSTQKLDDVEAYDGMAKDDYVLITYADNTVAGKDTYTKLDSVISGTITGVKGSTFIVDGTTYDTEDVAVIEAIGAYDVDTEISEAVVYNGYVFYMDMSSSVNADDYCLVTAFDPGGFDDPRAKVLFADGSEATVTVDDDVANQPAAVPALYTYEVDKDVYSFTAALTSQTDKESGFDDILPGMSYTYAKDGKSDIDGARIDPAAVIFVAEGSKPDFSVITGEKLAKIATTDVSYLENVYADTDSSSGYTTVKLAYVYVSAVKDDNVMYGYVTSDATKVKNADGDNVLSFTLFDGTKDVDVQTVKGDVATFGSVVGEGCVIQYTMDGEAIDMDDCFLLDQFAPVGAIVTYNGKDEINILTSVITTDPNADYAIDASGSSTGLLEIDEDTVILCVDNDEIAGTPGASLALADKTPSDNYYANCCVLYTGTHADLIVYGLDILNQM